MESDLDSFLDNYSACKYVNIMRKQKIYNGSAFPGQIQDTLSIGGLD